MRRHNRPHFVALLGECALLIPFVTAVLEGRLGGWCTEGVEGSTEGGDGSERGGGGVAVWQSFPSTGCRRWRITREKIQKLRGCGSLTGAINCRGSVGSQCPLCRWGIFCWWPATGPHTPGGRGACKVISYRSEAESKNGKLFFM